MVEPVFAPSTLNCTLATATLSLALTVAVTVPERAALETGEVMETVGGVVSVAVGQARSPLTAELFFASVERTRQW